MALIDGITNCDAILALIAFSESDACPIAQRVAHSYAPRAGVYRAYAGKWVQDVVPAKFSELDRAVDAACNRHIPNLMASGHLEEVPDDDMVTLARLTHYGRGYVERRGLDVLGALLFGGVVDSEE